MKKDGPVIYIDDDSDECELLQEAFDLAGIANPIRFFSTGQEAFEHFIKSGEQPFLIISDINMPVMTGLQLRKLFDDDETARVKSIPFIFLTTSANPASIEAAYKMRVQGFFKKPNSVEELGALMKEICAYWQHCYSPNG